MRTLTSGSIRWALAAVMALAGCTLPGTDTKSEDASVDTSIETTTTTEVELVSEQWTDNDNQVSMDIDPEWAPIEVDGAAGAWFIGPPTGGPQPLVAAYVLPREDLGDDTLAQLIRTEANRSEEFALIRSGKVDGPEGERNYFIENTSVLGDDAAPWHHLSVFIVDESTVTRANFITPEEYWDEFGPKVAPYLETIQNVS